MTNLVASDWLGSIGLGNRERIYIRASLFVSGCDIDLRVLGLLKMVTFAGAVTFSGAEPTKLNPLCYVLSFGS